MPGYLVDENNIKYSEYSSWEKDYCNYQGEYYVKESKTMRLYQKIQDVRYILLENFEYNDNIKIYQNNSIVNYKIINNENQTIKIDLGRNYMSDTLMFYIEATSKYKISLYADNKYTNAILSKEIENEKVLMPNKTWIVNSANFQNYYTINYVLNETELTKMKEVYSICRYREKYVYKYKKTKEYYDDNYHLNVEGYIKDYNDYQVYYKGEPITNTIEIIKEKIVKQPQLEYIYIEKENNEKETDSSKEKECLPQIETKVETKIIEKEKNKIPKIIYLIIILLVSIIIFLLVKKRKKIVV